MKYVLVVLALVAAAAAEKPVFGYYHETIGIPRAEQIRRAEEGSGLDGARIIGGQPAPLGAYPHMGGLLITLANGWTSVCGSSLISNTKLVTAAHCWFDGVSFARQFTVVLGSTTIYSGGVRITTSNVVMHENYETINNSNDIAVITIPWVGFTNTIQAINLATGNNDFVGSWATAAGFGLTNVGGAPSPTLNHVNLQVITNAQCTQTYGPSVILSSTLCTGGTFQNICTSDSGGPLSIGNQLIGVVSFGAFGCENGLPSGYARVTFFANWIRSKM